MQFAHGTKGDDVVAGTQYRDFILGFAGDDTITAGNGRAVIWGATATTQAGSDG